MWPFRKSSRPLYDDCEQERKENIECALVRQDVQSLLHDLNLGVQDIEEFHDRLKRIGLSNRKVRKVLKDTEILQWYFSILPSDKRINLQEFMELSGWLIKKKIV